MATQRYISTSFWDDEWIQELDPSEKLLYLYLMTNPLTNIAGVYKLSIRRISFDTGFTEDIVKNILERFEKDKKVRETLESVLKFKRSGELLDIGAGFGRFLHFAEEYFNIMGTEISSEGVKLAKKRYGIDIIHKDVRKIKFKKKFDVITLVHVLEHVPYPGTLLKYTKGLLKPSGLLYIAVPNDARYSLRIVLPGLLSWLGFKKFKEFSYNGFRKLDLEIMKELHVSHFSERILKKYLKSIGFNILGSKIDFKDHFMFRKGLMRVIRYLIYFKAYIFRAVFRVNIYGAFWIMAEKN